MAKIDRLGVGVLAKIQKRLRALETATPLNNASIGRNGLRVHSGGVITIENGGLSITGTAEVIGALIGDGTLTWAGAANFDGPLHIDGATDINGTLEVNGATTLTGDMTVNAGGKITVAGSTPVTLGVTSLGLPGVEFAGGDALVSTAFGLIMKSGASGGRVSATSGAVSMALGAKSVAIGGTQIDLVGTTVVTGSFSATSKAFKIPHPTKPNTWLMHGVTESPVHGVEYTAVGTFDPHGECVVTLPDYFEALTKAEGRTVFITAIGKPYPVGADLPHGGAFTAYGEAGRSFSWLVKAARSDVEVIVEQPT